MILFHIEFYLDIAFDSSKNSAINKYQAQNKKRAEARFLLHDQQ